jgi:acyl-CoA thioesterase FadM
MSHSSVDVEVRWTDVDAFGHVHHIALVGIAEHGRSRWIDAALQSDSTWPYVVVRVAFDFRSPAVFEERTVTCSFQVLDVGKSSITLQERLAAPDGRAIADAESVIVAWDAVRSQSRPLAAVEVERLGVHRLTTGI